MPVFTLRPRCLKQAYVMAALVAALSLGGGSLAVSPVRASDTFTIVDTLAPATPATKFDRNGSGGMTISAFQQVGPKFTLTQTTAIAEIGGFIADGGVFGTAPAVVQIRPSLNGNPDPSTVLATFELSTDNDPLITSYESVAPNVTLGAGIYFALFAEPEGSVADHFLLCCASSPFEYRAGSPEMGALCSGTPCQVSPGFPAAVRILGRSASDTTPPTLTVPGDIFVNATSPDGARVDYTVTATDDVDPSPNLVCTPPSGSMFAIGDTQVQCTASDAAGNMSSASFTVHVSVWTTGHGRFGTEGDGRVSFTLSNEQVTFDRGTRFSFTGDVDSVSGQGSAATLTGTGTWKGQSGYAFEVSVVDNAPWGRLKDTIDVVVRDPAGVIVLTSFGPQLLKQGDIVVTHTGST